MARSPPEPAPSAATRRLRRAPPTRPPPPPWQGTKALAHVRRARDHTRRTPMMHAALPSLVPSCCSHAAPHASAFAALWRRHHVRRRLRAGRHRHGCLHRLHCSGPEPHGLLSLLHKLLRMFCLPARLRADCGGPVLGARGAACRRGGGRAPGSMPPCCWPSPRWPVHSRRPPRSPATHSRRRRPSPLQLVLKPVQNSGATPFRYNEVGAAAAEGAVCGCPRRCAAAPPFSPLQFFVFRNTDSTAAVVLLATEASPPLLAFPPGFSHAVKLVSGANAAAAVETFIMHPTAAQTTPNTYPAGATAGFYAPVRRRGRVEVPWRSLAAALAAVAGVHKPHPFHTPLLCCNPAAGAGQSICHRLEHPDQVWVLPQRRRHRRPQPAHQVLLAYCPQVCRLCLVSAGKQRHARASLAGRSGQSLAQPDKRSRSIQQCRPPGCVPLPPLTTPALLLLCACREPTQNTAYLPAMVNAWVQVTFDVSTATTSTGSLCGDSGAFTVLPAPWQGDSSGTCWNVYTTLADFMSNAYYGTQVGRRPLPIELEQGQRRPRRSPCATRCRCAAHSTALPPSPRALQAFFNDAIVLGFGVGQASPGATTYWNGLQARGLYTCRCSPCMATRGGPVYLLAATLVHDPPGTRLAPPPCAAGHVQDDHRQLCV